MKKKLPSLLLLGVVAVALVLLYTGYVFASNASVEGNLKKVENSMLSYQDKLTQYEEKNFEQAINAKRSVDSLKAGFIRWSVVVDDIQSALPKDSNKNPLVDVLSYSGSGDNKIVMNVRTNTSSKNPYFDVAQLIEAFDESELFVDNFVPSVSGGISQTGDEVITFMFNTMYVGEAGPEADSAQKTQR